MSFVVKCHFRIDPIDAGLIINEQAINLTSQYTDEVRDKVEVSQFLEDVRSLEKNLHFYKLPPGILKGGRSIKDADLSVEGEKVIREIETHQILKRWKSPSIIDALNYQNVFRFLIFNIVIFFKFRVVNKRMQNYADQIDNYTGTLIHVGLLLITYYVGHLLAWKRDYTNLYWHEHLQVLQREKVCYID